jgi:hypothetical protein
LNATVSSVTSYYSISSVHINGAYSSQHDTMSSRGQPLSPGDVKIWKTAQEPEQWALPDVGERPSFMKRSMSAIVANPLVPLGLTATVGALGGGLYNFYKGRRHNYQKFMWARIAGQGFTIVVLTAAMLGNDKVFKSSFTSSDSSSSPGPSK